MAAQAKSESTGVIEESRTELILTIWYIYTPHLPAPLVHLSRSEVAETGQSRVHRDRNIDAALPSPIACFVHGRIQSQSCKLQSQTSVSRRLHVEPDTISSARRNAAQSMASHVFRPPVSPGDRGITRLRGRSLESALGAIRFHVGREMVSWPSAAEIFAPSNPVPLPPSNLRPCQTSGYKESLPTALISLRGRGMP